MTQTTTGGAAAMSNGQVRSGFTWRAAGWRRPDPAAAIQERTWTDPCPACAAEVTSIDGELLTVIDNPAAVITIHDPYCPWDDGDPDSPDCTCTQVINPAPDPAYDQPVPAGAIYTLRPCGHQARTIRVYKETRPEPGTLGALAAAWAEQEQQR